MPKGGQEGASEGATGRLGGLQEETCRDPEGDPGRESMIGRNLGRTLKV